GSRYGAAGRVWTRRPQVWSRRAEPRRLPSNFQHLRREAPMTSPTDVTAVDHLDLERYLGLWYEIARLPMRYEDDAASNVTAAYALNEDGSVQVDNRCFDADGQPTQALGRATPAGDSPAQLEVTFLPGLLRW